MSLIDSIKAHYEEEKSPPDGPDLDYVKVDGEWVKGDTVTERVCYMVIDDTPRWGDRIQVIYRRGDELVAVEDIRPATEYQDWGDYGDPEIYPVKAEQVTVTKYERV